MRSLFLAITSLGALFCFFVLLNEPPIKKNREQIWQGNGSLQLPRGEVFYELTGSSDSAPIIFIQGPEFSPSIWKPLVAPLEKEGFQTLRFEFFASKTSFSSDQAQKNQREQLVNILQQLGLKGPFHLVAFSEGAIIAANFARSFPSLVKKVAFIGLENPNDKILPPGHWLAGAPVIGGLIERVSKPPTKALRNSFLSQVGRTHKATLLLWGQSNSESSLKESVRKSVRSRGINSKEFPLIEGTPPIESLSQSIVLQQIVQSFFRQ